MARSPKKSSKSSKSSSRSSSPEKKSRKKSPKSPSKTHPTYREMISKAIYDEKKRGGSSRQAISKYIVANYSIDEDNVKQHLAKAIRTLEKDGVIVPNQGRGSFKLAPKTKIQLSGKSPKKKTTKRKTTKGKGSKKKKDKDAPKRPNSAWIYFSVKKREELKKKDNDLTFGELSKKAAAEWRKLSDSKKKKWQDLADDDKKRYEKELKAYKKKKPASSSSSSSEESSSADSSSSSEKSKEKEKEKEKGKESD